MIRISFYRSISIENLNFILFYSVNLNIKFNIGKLIMTHYRKFHYTNSPRLSCLQLERGKFEHALLKLGSIELICLSKIYTFSIITISIFNMKHPFGIGI